jgi:tellurite resistance protein TehA-like permease
MRFPLRYDPLYWGAVFPLGMYSAATHEMGQALALEFLAVPTEVFLYVGIIAWAATFAGLAWRIVQHVLRHGPVHPA